MRPRPYMGAWGGPKQNSTDAQPIGSQGPGGHPRDEVCAEAQGAQRGPGHPPGHQESESESESDSPK